jgi:hypothetical protein
MWQRIRPRYQTSNDIPLLDADGTHTSQGNGVNHEMSLTSGEIETIPFQRRQNSRESDTGGKLLDPCQEDDENDSELIDNEESVDRL